MSHSTTDKISYQKSTYAYQEKIYPFFDLVGVQECKFLENAFQAARGFAYQPRDASFFVLLE